jgi:DNA-directed RNA polymerase subunit omega
MARVTVEDCLESEKNRFALVLLATERARALMKGEEPLVECKNKAVVTALREIAAGKVKYSDTVANVVRSEMSADLKAEQQRMDRAASRNRLIGTDLFFGDEDAEREEDDAPEPEEIRELGEMTHFDQPEAVPEDMEETEE